MCHIHADYKSIDSALNPYFTFFDAGVGILQSIVLCHVDSSYAFSAQALEADWGGRMKTEGTCWFQFACCSYQSHPMHVASPWLQQWFPTYSIILLFASHLHHPPLPYPTPQGVKGLPGLVPGLVTRTTGSSRALLWTNVVSHQHMCHLLLSFGSVGLLYQFLNISCSEVRVLICKTSPGLPASGWQSLLTYMIFRLCGTHSWLVVSENSNVFHCLWRQNPFSH